MQRAYELRNTAFPPPVVVTLLVKRLPVAPYLRPRYDLSVQNGDDERREAATNAVSLLSLMQCCFARWPPVLRVTLATRPQRPTACIQCDMLN